MVRPEVHLGKRLGAMPYPNLDETFHAEARLEFDYGSEYYCSASPGLSRKFVIVSDEVLADNKLFPELGVQVHPPGIHLLMMRKFSHKVGDFGEVCSAFAHEVVYAFGECVGQRRIDPALPAPTAEGRLHG